MDEAHQAQLRTLIPEVIAVLVRRGADFAAAEDAVQEALIRALDRWPSQPPDDAKGWLITVAWRTYLDTRRSEAARRDREARAVSQLPSGTGADPEARTFGLSRAGVPTGGEAGQLGDTPDSAHGGPDAGRFFDVSTTGAGPDADDTLQLYFLCAHPSLSPSSAVALTLRAVGGLTTRQIAEAYLVPEATMAQRISRAKRRLDGVPLDQPGTVVAVLRVLYLVFNEGYSGSVDLAAEAIRLARQMATLTDEPEAWGLLALMLLHHARRAARTTEDGRLVPLAQQDRSRWDRRRIAEGIDILQAVLLRDRLGEYQAQAAIAALHADAPRAEDTDWVQIVEWYDELVRLTGSPIARLNRAVAVGEADGPEAGLAALAQLDPALPRHTAAEAYLLARAGDHQRAADRYVVAARLATNRAERDHLTREAARCRRLS